MPLNDELGQRFSEWQALTDAYAEGLEALLHEEPGAARRLAAQGAYPEQRGATAQSRTNQ